MTVTCLSHGSHVPVTCQSYGSHVGVTCLSPGGHMSVTCRSPASQVAVMWVHGYSVSLHLPVPTCLMIITFGSKIPILVEYWWHKPLFPALGRQRQADLCELKASLVSRVSAMIGSKSTKKNSVSKQNKRFHFHFHNIKFVVQEICWL